MLRAAGRHYSARDVMASFRQAFSSWPCPENVCLRIPFPSPLLKCWQLQSRSITLTPLLALCQHWQVIGSKGHEKGEITKCIGCTKQAVRSGCQGCSTCEGFEIWFWAADANDPNVMLFCSQCGCATDKHSMDQASCATPTLCLLFLCFSGPIYSASQGLCFDLCRTVQG